MVPKELLLLDTAVVEPNNLYLNSFPYSDAYISFKLVSELLAGGEIILSVSEFYLLDDWDAKLCYTSFVHTQCAVENDDQLVIETGERLDAEVHYAWFIRSMRTPTSFSDSNWPISTQYDGLEIDSA